MNPETLTIEFLSWSESIVGSFGYAGIFLISFIAAASVVFPVPAYIIVFASGAVLNPILVGVAAGAGAALGELTGYALGRGGGKIMERRYAQWVNRGRELCERYRTFPVIVLFAATPLPDDVVGILCGIFRYSARKFILAALIGKVIMNTAIAFGGFYGINWLLNSLAAL